LSTLGGDDRIAFVLALPFALGLHVFRDLNWYTIEKSAVFVLPLYGTCWLKTLRHGGLWILAAALVALAAALLNLYFGMLLAFSAATATLVLMVPMYGVAWRIERQVGRRGLRGVVRTPVAAMERLLGAQSLRWLATSYVLTAALATPLVFAQVQLLQGGRAVASPECYLWQRAALDSNQAWPPAWNRLEAWRALNLVALAAAAWTALRHGRQPVVAGLLIVAALFAGVSLGPEVNGAYNPLYRIPWDLVPMFWRIAEPEVFFLVSWLCLLATAAWGLTERRWSRRAIVGLYGVFVLGWAASVRTHPAYPGFTVYKAARLAPGWEKRLSLTPEECASDRLNSASDTSTR
jgi:hypothetical protein